MQIHSVSCRISTSKQAVSYSVAILSVCKELQNKYAPSIPPLYSLIRNRAYEELKNYCGRSRANNTEDLTHVTRYRTHSLNCAAAVSFYVNCNVFLTSHSVIQRCVLQSITRAVTQNHKLQTNQ